MPKIELETSSQGSNMTWTEERLKKIIASKFLKICKLRNTTSFLNTVEDILYLSFKGSAATNYDLDLVLLKKNLNTCAKMCFLLLEVGKTII